MNILFLTRHFNLGSSTRLRSLQYLPWFTQAGFTYTVSPLIEDNAMQAYYQTGNYSLFHLLRAYSQRIYALIKKKRFDLIWIEKESLPFFPAWTERMLLFNIPYTLDYDDATFHKYDQHPSALVRYCLSRRIDKIMAGSALVTAGNSYLATRAFNAGAQNVEVLPTVIDLLRYPTRTSRGTIDSIPRIVWIGSPSTLKYLILLQKPLARLSHEFAFKLTIICSVGLDLPEIDVEFVPWTEATEVSSLQACDIGVMPLHDSSWERGKCGYKLIQYMACGLPVVASPVGVNKQIVRNGENGYLAATDDEWVAALRKLLRDTQLRKQMGEIGRSRVESEFCTQQIAPKLIQSIKRLLRK